MNKLKELRKENKKTQQEIAEKNNIPIASYVRYENETTQPDIDSLIKLADYYGVSIDYLVGREYNNEIGYLTSDEKEIIVSIKKLNETNKIKAVSFIMGLLAVQN